MSRSSRILFLSLLFLSGFAGLAYETVWLYLARTAVGSTLAALSITLCAFMGGLALGGRAGASLGTSRLHPAALFGLIEMALALAGWGAFLLFAWNKSALPAMILLPFLMGLSFPPAVRALSGPDRGPGAASGSAYFANTLGAATGVLLCGFIFLEKTGVVNTLWIACAANLIAGLTAFLVFRHAGVEEQGPSSLPEKGAKNGAGLLFIYGLFGFTLLACEILWIRLLELRFLSTGYGFALTLAVLLAGIALGGRFFPGSLDRKDASFLHSLFFVLLAVSGLLVPLSGLVLNGLPLPFPPLSFPRLVAAQSAVAIAGILPLSLASGFAFPLCVRLRGRDSAGELYAANTLGGLLAALAVPFILIPFLGLAKSLAAMAALCGLLLPALLLLNSRGLIKRAFIPLAMLPILAAAPIWKTGFRKPDPEGKRTLYYREGPSATVSVTGFLSLPYLELNVNGVRTEGGTAPEALRSQRMQMELPLSLCARPESVLALGLGSGITIGALCKDPRVKHADCAEISGEIMGAAPWFREAGQGVLDSPWVTLVHADARRFVASCVRKYDLVVGDLFFPWMQGTGLLYSREHFLACRSILKEKGLFCQWIPLYQLSPEGFRVIENTFASVFPRTELWMGHFSADKPVAALVGCADTAFVLPASAKAMFRRFVHRAAFDPAAAVESDLNPRTEFLAARDLFRQYASNARFSHYFEEQYRYAENPFPETAADRAYLAGLFRVFQLYQDGAMARALFMLDSLSLLDSALPEAEFILPPLCRYVHDNNQFELMNVSKRLLGRVTRRYGEDFQLFGLLGKFSLLDKEYPECIDAYGRCIRVNPRDENALLNLGICLAMTGADSLARAAWQRVLEINPGNGEASYNIMLNSRSHTR